jgi:hypothetical protein
VITLPHTAKWRILAVALRAATRGLGPQPTAKHYAFTTLQPIPLQLDGELLALDPDTPVRVDIAPSALATVADQHLPGTVEPTRITEAHAVAGGSRPDRRPTRGNDRRPSGAAAPDGPAAARRSADHRSPVHGIGADAHSAAPDRQHAVDSVQDTEPAWLDRYRLSPLASLPPWWPSPRSLRAEAPRFRRPEQAHAVLFTTRALSTASTPRHPS